MKNIFRILLAIGLTLPVMSQSSAKKETAQKMAKQHIKIESVTPTQSLESENRKYQGLEAFAKALNILESQYVDPNIIHTDELIENALKGMIDGVDAHTSYLSKDQYQEFMTGTSGKFGGIGVVVKPAHAHIEVVEVYSNTPADRVGMKAGDVILSIDGIEINSKSVEEALNLMRGPVGTKIKVKYIPLQKIANHDNLPLSQQKTVTLEREVVRVKSVEFKTLSKGYGYIKLSLFQDNASVEMKKELQIFADKNGGVIKGLVFDLRNNPGGLLDEGIKVTNLFIDSGIIVSTIGRNKKTPEEVEYALKRNSLPHFPLVILVNEGTASASEIVAGALQDRERAIIMGSTTFGKGSVQNIIPLPNGGAIKLTIARYYTPSGRSIQAKGISPDIPLISQDMLNKFEEYEGERVTRKEANLQKHIESIEGNSHMDNLTPEINSLKKSNENSEIGTWPKSLKNDFQVKSAYLYLKNMSKYASYLKSKQNKNNRAISSSESKIIPPLMKSATSR